MSLKIYESQTRNGRGAFGLFPASPWTFTSTKGSISLAGWPQLNPWFEQAIKITNFIELF